MAKLTGQSGRSNSEVLRPLIAAADLVGRHRDRWLIDFTGKTELEAALFEKPFAYVKEHVYAERLLNRQERLRLNWWLLRVSAFELRAKIPGLSRMCATSLVAKYRLFRWIPTTVAPDTRIVVFPREDDSFFGILSGRFHELWSLSIGTWHGVGNDPIYTPTTCFETFPFPEGLTPNILAVDYANDPRAIAIAEAAKKLNELREAWLNPEDLVERVPEVVPGYPDRIVPKDDKAAAILKKRTLTNLYNERPAWLDHAHRALDEAVAAAYGWPADLSDEEILERLFKLNQQRATAQAAASAAKAEPTGSAVQPSLD